jgi:hypothetical protein
VPSGIRYNTPLDRLDAFTLQFHQIRSHNEITGPQAHLDHRGSSFGFLGDTATSCICFWARSLGVWGGEAGRRRYSSRHLTMQLIGQWAA